VLCDTRDTSILIADTYVTIPVSPNSRYTAVYRSSKKYRETAQVSRVSTIPRVSYHWATSSLQAYDAKTNVIVTHIEALRKQQSLSQQESRAAARKPRQVVVHAPASCGRGLEGDGRSILEVMRRRRRRHAKSSENVLSDYSCTCYCKFPGNQGRGQPVWNRAAATIVHNDAVVLASKMKQIKAYFLPNSAWCIM